MVNIDTEYLKFENKHLMELLLQSLVDKVKESSSVSYSLFSGRSGELLFLYEAAKYPNCRVDLNWLSDEISLLVTNANKVLPNCSMASGMAGIAWFYQYVLQDQQETDDENGSVDILFNEMLASDKWHGEYEYTLGLAGFAPYLARRTHTPQGKVNARVLIEHFSRLAVIEEGLAYWPTLPESTFRINNNLSEVPEINLGLAHGHTGVLAALLSLSREPSVAQAALPLLVAGCDWLISQQQEVGAFQSYFAYLSSVPAKSRLAWCYGDLTISLTLSRVGKFLERKDYTDFACAVALHSARRDALDARIKDIGLCHGSSGLALIFRLLYRELQAPELLESAKRWQNFNLQQYKEHGLTAFHKWTGNKDGRERKEEDFGLLEGYAGIGLSLLTGLAQEPNWADALLLA
ncbi:hypothetical protein WG68_08315 [Arsukibacterium ikkense]|uniref:Lantibiotic biosynthesis protein n=1 Tax=Arsukibacterium ikkense TaxID=336831 RepID=A0A0M2V4E5_9GAMM|nr:lanthionine synthetase LanC family protein [Arsukibacterium ikkense]KKO45712.1 hypothetical protein WG68_08315 [Arsukibacterium ikkense]